jgi:arsenate reductase
VSVKILHNPRCSKSRATLALLGEHGVKPEVVLYLEQAPTPEALRDILRQLDMAPRELLRKGEAVFRELQLADESLSDDALIKAMTEHPILIERPVVIANGKAAIGRPPENVLQIL